MAQRYTESLLNNRSAPDGRSYSLYQVFILAAQTYTKLLLNDRSTHDGCSYSLDQVLTLLLMVALTVYVGSLY